MRSRERQGAPPRAHYLGALIETAWMPKTAAISLSQAWDGYLYRTFLILKWQSTIYEMSWLDADGSSNSHWLKETEKGNVQYEKEGAQWSCADCAWSPSRERKTGRLTCCPMKSSQRTCKNPESTCAQGEGALRSPTLAEPVGPFNGSPKSNRPSHLGKHPCDFSQLQLRH